MRVEKLLEQFGANLRALADQHHNLGIVQPLGERVPELKLISLRGV